MLSRYGICVGCGIKVRWIFRLPCVYFSIDYSVYTDFLSYRAILEGIYIEQQVLPAVLYLYDIARSIFIWYNIYIQKFKG